MCLICVDLIKDKLTSREAMKNLNELVQGNELDNEQQAHVVEVLKAIHQKKEKENWNENG